MKKPDAGGANRTNGAMDDSEMYGGGRAGAKVSEGMGDAENAYDSDGDRADKDGQQERRSLIEEEFRKRRGGVGASSGGKGGAKGKALATGPMVRPEFIWKPPSELFELVIRLILCRLVDGFRLFAGCPL